jgi:Ca-activated chloride channel family protein
MTRPHPRPCLAFVALLAALVAPTGPPAAGQDALLDVVDRALGGATHLVIPQTRSFPLRDPAVDVRLEAVHAAVQVRERAASTTLDVTLRNVSSRRAEAVLLLPVPAGAAVGSFAFQGAASEPTAQLLPRDEARRLYDAIVAKLLDPALLEFADWNLVRSSVFPVEPGATMRVRLSYDHLLTSDGDRVDYLLPRSESLAPSCPWHIEADVAAERPISMVYSPTHEIETERIDAQRFRVRVARSDGDGPVAAVSGASCRPGPFRLSYLSERDGVSASFFAYPDPSAGGGYFLMMTGLPAAVARDAAQPREVTIVLDRSGSMAGGKLDQVRAAALQVIEGLADGEFFNVLDYAHDVAAMAPRPLPRSAESIERARAYLASIRPSGGTNIHDALLEALRQSPTEGTLPLVLFLTDGLPTIGRTRETTIRGMVEAGNPHERRIFTFGVGSDVNAPLLDRVAETSRGFSSYVLPGEDVEVEIARAFRRLGAPVLAAPSLDTTDTAGAVATHFVRDVMPPVLPDLFDGDGLIVLGRYRTEEPFTIRVAGTYLGAARTFAFDFDPAQARVANAFVPRLWASRRIAFLVDAIRQSGAEAAERPLEATASADAPRELVDEIIRLSTEFGILTEYTAFLATDGADLSSWDAIRAGCTAELNQKAVHTRCGTGAVTQAMNFTWQKGQSVLNYENAYVDDRLQRVEFAQVQQLCDRAFFRRGNRWIDSRLVPGAIDVAPHRVITLGTPEHAELLRRLSAEGRQALLSLPGEILLRDNDEIVLIDDGC